MNRSSNVKRIAKKPSKLASKALAVLVALSMIWWQTPVYAWADNAQETGGLQGTTGLMAGEVADKDADEDVKPNADNQQLTTNNDVFLPGIGNTVNADGTVTDSKGYTLFIAPEDNSTKEITDSSNGDAEATAALNAAESTVDTLRNGTGVKLFGFRLLGADPVDVSELDNEGDGSKIEAIRVRWLTPDTSGSAYVADADRLSLVPGNDSQQAMKFQVEFALSGQFDYQPGDVEFTIPATIWTDHSGNPVGYMTLSVPEEPETGAEFAYRLVNGNYIITNTHRLPAASKAAFQFTIRGVTPHTVVDSVVPVVNPDGSLKDLSGKTVAKKGSGGYETVEASALSEDELKDGTYFIIDNGVSNKIQPTITVRTHEGNTLALTTPNALDATIDTAERLTSATKSGELFENTPSNLPAALLNNLPEGTTKDDYLYVRWQTYCYHSGNQVFTLDLEDGLQQAYEVVTNGNNTTSNVLFDDQGIILGGLNTSGQAVGTVSEDRRSIDFGTIFGPDYHSNTSYLYDHLHYVWSAYPKYQMNEDGTFVIDEGGNKVERFQHGHVYVFPNKADWSLTGADDGITTTANPPAQGTVRYAPQKFIAPIGDYATHKWTESSYKDYTYGYYLDQLRANKPVTMNFRVQTSGHTLSWTLGRDEQGNPLDPTKQENYGQRAVKFETYDDDTFFNYDWETPITHEDFEFVSIRFNTPSMSNYGKFANGSWGYLSTSDATLKPDIEVYGQVEESGNWVHFATVSWNGNSMAENGATINGTTVTFPSNVTDVKHVFETKAAAVTVDAYPVIRLKASDRVKQLVEKLYAESEFPVSKFQNNVHMDVSYPDTGDAIGSMLDQSRATLTGTTLAISSDKSVSFNPSVDNDTIRHRVTLHYTTKVYEQTNIENRSQYDDAVEAKIIPAETSGTWYDLLPLGVVPNLNSIKLRNGDAVKKVYTVENYKESGRTLLVVEAELKPQPTTISRKYADIPQLSFDAWYSWENVRDLGLTLVNRVAFESGTEGTYGSTVIDGQFGNVKNHMGEKDDPTGASGYMNNQTKDAVGGDAQILKDLDPNSDKGGFVYAKCVYSIDPDLETRVSLIKDVMDDSKGRWTSGLQDREQVTVYPGHPYTYRLRVEADSTSATKGIILYDSLENYVPTYDKSGEELDDFGHPQWRGIFRSVDLTQLEQEGIAPVVYYATEDHLAFEDSNDGSTSPVAIDELSMDSLFGHYDISNTSIWSTTPPDDLSKITAIAIDCSKKTDGTDFILGTYVDENGDYVTGTNSISALVHMVAPVDEKILYGDDTGIGDETWATGGSNAVFAAGDDKYNPEKNRYAYNNTRLVCKQGPGGLFDNESTRQMIRNDYTRVGILPYELTIKKLWNDTNNNDGKRPTSVTVNLQASWYDSDGIAHTSAAEYADPHGGPNHDGKVGPITITQAEDGTWTTKVERIKYVNDATHYVPLQYSLTEDEVAGYRFSAQQGNRNVNGTLVGNEDNYFTVVNTHELEKVLLSGRKDWNDEENEAGVRPGSIKVNLLADGKVVQTKTVTKGDNGDWSYSFGKLNKYARTLVTDDDGTQHYETHEIKYSVTEEYIPKYTLDGEDSATTLTDANPAFLLVNDYNPLGDLAVQKSLVDATDVAADKEFTFTVLLTREKPGEDGQPLPVDGEFTYEVVDASTGDPVMTTPEGGGDPVPLTGTVQSGGTIKVKGGQKAIIKDIPSESTYQVVETPLDGFLETSSSGTQGTIRSGQVVVASFENTYSSAGNVELSAVKSLKGRQLSRYQFRFQLLADENGQPGDVLRSVSNEAPGEDGTARAPFTMSYTNDDDGKDFTYYIVEVNTEKVGYTYDDAVYKVVVHVADNGNGTLTCTPTYYQKGAEGEETWVPIAGENLSAAGTPVFHNTYHATGKLTLRTWKTLAGRDLNDDEFTFQLRDGETGQVVSLDSAAGEEGKYNIVAKDAVLPEGHTATEQVKKNTKDGDVQFDPIVWDETALMQVDEATGNITYLDKKVYLFTVNEVVGNKPEVNYDSSFKGYEVTVIDNGDGTLSIAQGNVDVSDRIERCADCNGTGEVPGQDNAGTSVCQTCNGTGMVVHSGEVTKVDDIPVFANILKPGNLSVTKVAEGENPNPEQEFNFRVELVGSGIEDGDISYEITKTADGGQADTSTAKRGAAAADKADDVANEAAKTDETVKEGSNDVAESEGEEPDGTSPAVNAEGTDNKNDGGTTAKANVVTAKTSTQDSDVDPISALFAPKKAYAAEGDSNPAYAILDSDGNLIFFRSADRYNNGRTYTVWIDGASHRGIVYTGVENTTQVPPWQTSNYNNTTIKSVWVAQGQKIRPTRCENWFRGCSNLTSFNAEGFDMSHTVNMAFMFGLCKNIRTLDLSSFDTSSLEVMNSMFNSCTALTDLKVSGFNTSKVINMGHLFTKCESLTSLDLSGWNVEKVQYTDVMFSDCSSLVTLNLNGWRIMHGNNMSNMFSGCSSLTSLDVSGWDVSNARLNDMFLDCKSLTKLDLSSWVTTNARNMNGMFENCSSLEELDISGFDTSNLISGNTSRNGGTNSFTGRKYYPETGGTYGMFAGTSLKKIVLGPDFKFTNGANSGLPNASSTDPYTGFWMNETNPDSDHKSANDLMTGYAGSTMSGTWVWEVPPTTYSLRFDMNNPKATGSIPDQKGMEADKDQVIDTGGGSFYEYGKNVTGWNTKPDGTGTHFDYSGPIPANTFEPNWKPYTLYAEWDGSNSATLQNGTFEFSMRAGYTATFPNLPAGTAYRVYEETPTGWVLVSQENTSGTIPSMGTAQAVFTNRYEPGSATVQLFATKTLDGQPASAGEAKFELRDEDGNLIEGPVSNLAGGFVQFNPITYHDADFKEGETELTYFISEIEGSDASIAYDTHQEKVTVTVTKTKGDDNLYTMTAKATYDEDGAAFKNTSIPGGFSLTKNTTNSSSDSNAEFEFTIKLTNRYGQAVDATSVQWYKTSASGEVTDAGSGSETPTEATTGLFTIKLKAGETAHFTNLPAGTTYEILESDIPVGWKQTGSEGLSGTIPAAGSVTASATNTYSASGFVALEAHKRLVGDTLETGQFSFQLKDSEGNVLQTASNGAVDEAEEVVDHYENEGTADERAVMVPNPHFGTAPVRFAEIDYTEAGTYVYTIEEVLNPDDSLITYDTNSVTATVKMEDDGEGKLVPTITYTYGPGENAPAGNTFTNTVKPGSLSISKAVENGTNATAGAKFPFVVVLLDASGNPLAGQTYAATGVEGIESVTTDAEGKATFSLADKDVLVIEGIPHGATYSVSEVEATADEGDGTEASSMPAGFTNTAKESESGTISSNETSAASFTNTYDAEGGVQLGAFKTLKVNNGERELAEGDFTFELRNANGDVIQSQFNDAQGKVVFDALEYSLTQIKRDVSSGAAEYHAATPAVPADPETGTEAQEAQAEYWTYAYSVDEYLPGGGDGAPVDGVSYDAHVEDVIVIIHDKGDGTLDVDVEFYHDEVDEAGNVTKVKDEDASFTNVYDDSSVNASLHFQKYYYSTATEPFQFQLQTVKMEGEDQPQLDATGHPVIDESVAPMTVEVSGTDFTEGKAEFSFDLGRFKKDGHHYYLVTEVGGSGVAPDAVQYLAHVQIKRSVVLPVEYTMLYPNGDKLEVMAESVQNPEFFNNDSSAMAALRLRSLGMSGYAADGERAGVYPEVVKYLNDSTDVLVGGDFTFELRDANGEVIRRASNDENGKVAFFDESAGDLGLVYDAPGTYSYTINEVIPDGAVTGEGGSPTLGGMTYDGSVISLVVTVEEVEGALKATEAYLGADGSPMEVPAFRNYAENMDLVVYKVSRFGGEGLDKCTYALWMVTSAGDVMVKEATSDETGRILFTDVMLLPGQKYYFKEVEAPTGHTVDPHRTAYFTLNDAGDGTIFAEELASDGWHSKYESTAG